MKKELALKKAYALANKVIDGIIFESVLWEFCYDHDLDMCEIWSEDDTEIIGFQIEDDVYYYGEN